MRNVVGIVAFHGCSSVFILYFRRVEVMRVDASGLTEEAAPATYDSELKGGPSWPWRQ